MRRAVVLMNLGGPDSLQAVRPFLYNLFSDPAIIVLPGVFRFLAARLLARRRTRAALDIYRHLGGGSPLLANTETQARALEVQLGGETRCFIAMRYWRPLTSDAVAAVRAWRPDEVVCLPLYPQYSTTTTGSSLAAWRREAARQGLCCPTREIASYPTADGYIAALCAAIAEVVGELGDAPFRLLFSAHGLPLKIVAAGDPYPGQIAQTAAAAVAALARPGLDWRICYQSRVGPLAWLSPSIDDEIRRAGQEQVGLVVAPISFVSEHSETLVELDRDYRRLAEQVGVPFYRRARTVGADPRFIAALAALVEEA